MKSVLFKLFSALLILAVLLNAAPPQTALAAAPGVIDIGFNTGPGAGANGAVYAVVRQSNGKILIGGAFTAYNGDANAPDKILRLNEDGSLDTSFNYNAIGANDDVLSIALQPDGLILIGGYFTGYNGDLGARDYLLRLSADGSIDPTFNGATSGPNSVVTALALQPADGSIIVGGAFTSYDGQALAPDRILRLSSTGALDTSFNYGSGSRGTNGTVNAILVQPDGQIVIGGIFNSYNGAANIRRHLTRLNGLDGSLDPTFVSSGANGPFNSANVRAIVRQADGMLLIGGLFNSNNGDLSAPDNLMRIKPDGTLDSTFNPFDSVNLNPALTSGPFASGYTVVNSLAIQTDDRIVVGGYFDQYNGDTIAPNHILRINSDGSLDTNFNSGASQGADNEVFAVALQPDGKILAGGSFSAYNADPAVPDAIVRLNVATLPPTVTIDQAATQPDPTATSPVNFTVVFSAPVSGFGDSAADVSLSGTAGATTAVVTQIAPNNGTTYNVAVSGMTASGTVIASIPAAVATDAYASANLASTSTDNTVTFDVAATVTINQAAGQIDPTIASPINFTVIFSKPVSGFGNSAADVTLSGTAGATSAIVSQIAPNDGTTYNVAVSGMSVTGTVIASVPAGAAQDAMNFGNLASTSTDNTVTFDVQASVTVNQAVGQADPTAVSPVNFTVVFSKPVTGFVSADVVLGGTAGATTAVVTQTAPNNGTTYNVAVSGMSTAGTVIASVPAGAAVDALNFGNLASTSTDNIITYQFPMITSIVPTSGPTSGGTAVTFYGSNLTAGSFTFGGVPATGCVISVDGKSATCFTPAHAAGPVTVAVTTTAGSLVMPGAFTYIPATLIITGSGLTTVKPGDQYMYTFYYENNTAVSNAVAHVTLPGHTTFVGSSLACVMTASVADCPLGNLPVAGRAYFNITVQVDKLKKTGTPLVLATSAYSLTATGGTTSNGAVMVSADTLSPFQDVPAGSTFVDYIQSIWAYGITLGCTNTPLNYCPANYITRGEMAVFIERGIHGGSFNPGSPAITFTDTAANPFKYFIEALAADGITSGCAPAMFCPDANVTRAQMAVFLLRGKFGRSYAPPAATGLVFVDVPASSFAADFIENLNALGITSGCSAGHYCPDQPVTRDTMAAMIQRTFLLPMPTP